MGTKNTVIELFDYYDHNEYNHDNLGEKMSGTRCPRKAAIMDDYEGPERRVIDRRQSDLCIWHEAHEQRFKSNETKISTVCTAVNDLRKVVETTIGTKVPMKLFYATAGGIIFLLLSLLAFQWGSYERLNNIGVNYKDEMSELKLNVQKITSAVENDRYINKLKMDQIDRRYEDIEDSLDRVEAHIKNGHD